MRCYTHFFNKPLECKAAPNRGMGRCFHLHFGCLLLGILGQQRELP